MFIYTQFNFGEIAGFSTALVELLFSPNEVGEYSQHFQITFSHPSVNPVSQTTFSYINKHKLLSYNMEIINNCQLTVQFIYLLN